MILVTGGTGFLGAHIVCRLLLQGAFVRATRRAESSMDEFNYILGYYFSSKAEQEKRATQVQWVEASVEDITSLEEATKGVRMVYHCAALVSFDSKDRDRLFVTNYQGTANVVNACLIQGVEVLCYASSVAALGRSKQGQTISENTKWENSSLNGNYALSKYKAEMEVWRGAEEGLQVCIVNPGVILGVGNYKKGSNAMIHTVYKGMPLYSMGVNGYVDVEDVASAMIALTERKVYGKRFVLVSESLHVRDVFFMIADAFEKKRPYISVSPFMGEIAWRLMALVRLFYSGALPITKETARAANRVSYYDNTAIKKALGFEFTLIKDTLAKACNEYKKTTN